MGAAVPDFFFGSELLAYLAGPNLATNDARERSTSVRASWRTYAITRTKEQVIHALDYWPLLLPRFVQFWISSALFA